MHKSKTEKILGLVFFISFYIFWPSLYISGSSFLKKRCEKKKGCRREDCQKWWIFYVFFTIFMGFFHILGHLKQNRTRSFSCLLQKTFCFQIFLVSSQKFCFFDPKADITTTPLKWVGIFIKQRNSWLE